MEAIRGAVLVLGGTGHYGRVLASGLAVRHMWVLRRNTGGASRLVGQGVEVVEGDSRDASARKLWNHEGVLVKEG